MLALTPTVVEILVPVKILLLDRIPVLMLVSQ
jgi:hypothetical protein